MAQSTEGSTPAIVLGGGGHAKVVIATLQRLNRGVLGVLDQNPALHGSEVLNCRILGGDDVLERYAAEQIVLVNGVGSVARVDARRGIFERLSSAGYAFLTVVDDNAFLSSAVTLGHGVQVMAGAIIQTDASVADNVLINSGAIVEHDCRIGAHTHIAPGAVLSGGVSVGDAVHIGTGAVAIQGVRIGSGAIVAAGAVVIHDVEPGMVVAGAPAVPVKQRRNS